jgi:predicted hydrocarbon binding protein
MKLTTKMMKWWVNNFYTKKVTKYEPGFIITEYNSRYGRAYQRLVVLPERVMAEIEEKFIKKFGAKGRKAMAKAGERYGYNMARTLGAPTLPVKGESHIKGYLENIINYGFSSWASEAQFLGMKISDKESLIEIKYMDHVVCRMNGIGVLLTESIPMGFIEYLLQKPLKLDSSRCQGRGDPDCYTKFVSDTRKRDVEELHVEHLSQYRTYNQLAKISSSRNSTKSMLETHKFEINDGIFSYHGEVLIPFEISILYVLDELFKKDPDILYNTFFDWGYSFSESRDTQFISDILAAFGFGDAQVHGKEVIIHHYPWYPLKDVSFTIIAGLTSGMLSRISGKKIHLKESKHMIDRNIFSVALS